MEQLVFDFTVNELQRLQEKSDDALKLDLRLNTSLKKGEYRLINDTLQGTLEAGCSKDLLTGVYHYAQDMLGYQFELSGTDRLGGPTRPITNLMKPRFTRRGNIFEVIHDTNYLLKQIDLNAKLGHNEMFFTFFLFDEVQEFISDDLRKRGFEVTLGGHSLKWLLEPILDLAKNEDDNLQFYKDERLMDYVIDRIITICKNNDIVRRISLWPQDIGIPVSKGYEFMQSYIDFNSTLKQRLMEHDLDVAVEFIVYNAGLNWEMLSYYDNLILDPNLDILFAYWGRDYSRAFEDRRALEALQSWITQGNVTVLEYYSDFFMMSELYPPLHHRIASDLDHYEKLGVQGVLNLVVPLLNSRTSKAYDQKYDYQSYHQKNNCTYSRCLWHQETITPTQLELTLSSLTRFNKVLFPKRLVDTVLDQSLKQEILSIQALLKDDGGYESMMSQVIEEMLYE